MDTKTTGFPIHTFYINIYRNGIGEHIGRKSLLKTFNSLEEKNEYIKRVQAVLSKRMKENDITVDFSYFTGDVESKAYKKLKTFFLNQLQQT